jgi:hypothetical protein
MQYDLTVYMDKRDVTPWITSVEIEQADSIHRKFKLVFGGWHTFDESNRWDIFETYDPTIPRAECVIRNGVVPADRQRLVKVEREAVPTITAEGYEYVWLAKRRAPSETVILVPSTRNVQQDADIAIKNHKGQGEVGTYRVWGGVRTLHDAIRRLMAAARIRVQIRIPNYELLPYLIDPSLSYWKAVEKLTDPFAPVRYYIRQTNTMVIADPTQTFMGAGSVLSLPDEGVQILDVQPQRLRRIRRVLMRKQRWL